MPTGNSSSKLLIAILLGIVCGAFLGGFSPEWGLKVSFIGEVFIRGLLCLAIPLVLASLIVGITGLGDIRKLGSLGKNTLIYYMSTTAIAVIIGLICVNLIEPGVGHSIDLFGLEYSHSKDRTIFGVLEEIIVRLIPKNIFGSMTNNEILPIIVFALLFGAALTTLGEKGKAVITFFRGANDAIIKIVQWLMLLAPIGIGALIAGRLGKAGGFIEFWPELSRLGLYAIAVITGLLIHGVLVLPLLLKFLGEKSPKKYLVNSFPALLTAFSTASSSATLPISMDCTARKNKVSEQNTGFVLPLGATINMDGTALYEAVAAVFIAQLYGIDLGFTEMLIIFLTATLAAIGAAGIPEAGLVTMAIVLQAVGLPLEGISLILIIDWFLDRCRTTINVWGDMVGAAIIDRFDQKDVVS
jgi:solute carrier family 1 (neuronal/epithelial high affinity glutamate transporter), member 1